MTVSLKVLQGRGMVEIVEASTNGKQDIIVVQFNDNDLNASAIYIIELTITFGGKS